MQKNNNNLYDVLFQDGLEKFNQKNYKEAISIFDQILEKDKNNIKANHAMGVVYGAIGDHTSSIKFLKKALSIQKNFIPSLKNLAISYFNDKSYEDSIKIYQQLLLVDSKDSYNYLNALGSCYSNLSKDDIASNFFIKSIEANKNQFKPFLNLGILKKKEKDFEKALEYFFKAEAIDKDQPLLWKHFADLYYKSKDFENAILYLNKQIEFDPNDTDTLFVLACAYFANEDRSTGVEIMDKLILITKTDDKKEKYYQKISSVIINTNNYDTDKDYSLCLKYSEEAIKLNSQNYAAYSYRAIAKFFNQDHQGAIQDAEKAKEINPKAEITLGNLSNFYKYLGDYQKAESTLNEYFLNFPDSRIQDFLNATVHLSQMKFEIGWEYYESRWFKDRGASKDKKKPEFAKPEWKPDMGFETILIWAEQGLGDQILHGSMLSDFSKKFKKTYLAIDPRLLEIFQKSFPDIHCYSLFDETNQDFFDYQIPLTSIGAYTRKSVNDFLPYRSPFSIFEKKLDYDKKRKLRCAISWKSTQGTHSKLKTSSLNDLSKILKIDQIEFYNIQYTDESEEIKQAQEDHGIQLINPPGLDVRKDLVGLIDFINNCDFVINISNTNAHLAGAIGKKTYLLLPTPAGRFWYWENSYNGKNIWYPSIQIFAQKEPYDWSDPVDRLYNTIKSEFNL